MSEVSDRPLVRPDITRPAPLSWWLVLIPAVLQLALHIYTNGRYGIFRDEYYYMACAGRPAWGYVDQPALSIWILAMWKAVFGDSIHALRVLPALCGSGLIVMCGAIAAELGGRRWAQLLSATAAGVGAAGLVICGFYSMNCFDLLFWTAAYWLVIRIARTGKAAWWPTLGLIVGFGLFNKIGLMVLGAALVPALVITRHREHFFDRRLYVAGGVALLFMAPYVVWNASHGWPTMEFMSNARQYKITAMSPLDFLSENVLMANPLTLPLWIAGLLWLLLARGGSYRIAGFMFIFTFAVLVVQKSKPYYLAASFPVLLAAGGVAWERWTRGRWLVWIRGVLLLVLLAGGYVFGPMALPVMEPADLVKYMQDMGIAPKAQEVGHSGVLPQHFSDRLGWEQFARAVSKAYTDLPAEDREACVAIGPNYGHAGALEYWAKKYELPPAFSAHNNYWFWGPPPAGTTTFILTGYGRETVEGVFDEVSLAGEVRTPLAQEDYIPVWVCRVPKRPIAERWQDWKNFI